jgi:integrase
MVGKVVGWFDMALTALEIKNAKPGMHADGGGLYLHVGKAGNASWIFRFQLNKRRREMGLGALLSLAPVEARAKAAELKAMVGRGIDPLELKQAVREEETKAVSAQREEEALNVATFKLATEKHLALKESGWRNAKHRQQWENTLTTYAYPVIGDLPVRDITTRHVLQVLEPIWSTKPETASRVRMRIEAVLNSAKVFGWRTGENPALWRGNLDAALPSRGKVRRVKHHPALPWRNIAAFMSNLKERDGISARALEFLVLTAARSGEVRRAGWSEIDLDQKLWVVPADRMKAGREHRVPLSDAAARLLSEMPRFQGYDLIFPGTRMQPLSDMSLSAVLKRMGMADITVHGFRSTFRDWAAEHTGHGSDIVEMALAHTISSKTEAAYRRGDLLAKRRSLMEDWAGWCGNG